MEGKMGRQHKKRRSMIIKIKKKRQTKLKKLRQQYAEGKKDKDRILEKAAKIAPCLTKEEFLEPVKKE